MNCIAYPSDGMDNNSPILNEKIQKNKGNSSCMALKLSASIVISGYANSVVLMAKKFRWHYAQVLTLLFNQLFTFLNYFL